MCGARVMAEEFGAGGPYPVRYDVLYPEKLSRWLIFVKGLLAFPHFIVLMALGYAVSAVTVVAFFAILFTRRYPRGLFNLAVGVNRWSANVTAYVYLFRDEYPPFSMDPDRYPVLYEVDYPERLSRWWIWVKWLLVLPHQFVLFWLNVVGFLFLFLSWFAILFTGRYPRTFFNFLVGLQRWTLRVNAYAGLLRDEFPPYSKRADAGPGGRRSIILSAVFGVLGGILAVVLFVVILVVAASGETTTVPVSYDAALEGRGTAPVDVGGTVVTLEGAFDPYEDDVLPEPDAGERYVAFGLDIANEDALLTFVDRDAFELADTSGDDHEPVDVFWPEEVTSPLIQDEAVTATVVFELDESEDPLTLTYRPAGPLSFGPLGGKVRYEFE
jgi:hypothetical protein